MTLRLVLGIDPGQSGAISALADGDYAGVFDMPCSARATKGSEVSGAALASCLRIIRENHPGAYVTAALEQINAMPSWGGKDVERRTMGSTSMLRFGEAFGVVKGVLGALGIGYVTVLPQTWKRHHGLIGSEKDDARLLTIKRMPAAASMLQRKKDIGRADALLIAQWAEQTEQIAPRPVGSHSFTVPEICQSFGVRAP